MDAEKSQWESIRQLEEKLEWALERIAVLEAQYEKDKFKRDKKAFIAHRVDKLFKKKGGYALDWQVSRCREGAARDFDAMNKGK